METPKIEHIISEAGHVVKNQYWIHTNTGKFFQSYADIICFVPNSGNEKILMDVDKWEGSETTNRYRELLLGETKAQSLKKIAEYKYTLCELNAENFEMGL